MRRTAILNPAPSISGAADVLAGYCIAAPALPQADHVLKVVPLLFASVFLLRASAYVFEVCFAISAGRTEPASASSHTVATAAAIGGSGSALKGVFLIGCVAALLGLFAALGASITAGRLPVYFAAFLFLLAK